ncbi:MAG: hypothetical protein K5872_20905 [Rhizobiaceae bacterium]|nr:hypothetical protein [Rhizobiaceae bacterium]MCV0408677.1 hypothetical protein [Rhizobiaceae bacterium]
MNQPAEDLRVRDSDPDRAADFLALFAGGEDRHGTYDVARLRLVGGKMEMKDERGNGARTLEGPPTEELWRQHLAGERPLGVIPLREDGMCRWGVIDSDDYTLTLADILAAAKKERLPLLVCRSKSGGAHLFLFCADWVPQASMARALAAMRTRLGIVKGELFPPEHGTGNWLNMPYFGGDQTDRWYAKTEGGLAGTVYEFLRDAEATRVGPEELDRLASSAARPVAPGRKPPAEATEDQRARAERDLERHAAEIGRLKEGARNTTLYGRAKDMAPMVEAGWMNRDRVVNVLLRAALESELPHGEALATIENGLRDGRDRPLPDAEEDRRPQIERIVVWTGGEDVLWDVHLAGHGVLKAKPKDVMNFSIFNTLCAAHLYVSFHNMKVNEWSDAVYAALRHREVREIPADETLDSRFLLQLQSFLTDRHRAENKSEILSSGWSGVGRPWLDDECEQSAEPRYYFRHVDLVRHLNTSGVQPFASMRAEEAGRLLARNFREGMDFQNTTLNIGGKTVRVKWIRADLFEEIPSIDPRPIPRDPM